MAPLFAGPYNFLYAAGFAAAFVTAWSYGRAKQWPMEPWSAVLGAAVVGGIVGSRVLHFEPGLPLGGEKTVLGGMIGGTFAVLAAAWYLRFGTRAVDAFAAAVPLGLGVGKVGCFLAGCCFGRPTDLAWSVSYAPGTEPFRAQVRSGLITSEAAASLPVHPVQLYEALFVFALAAAVWRYGGRFRQPGNSFLFVCSAYGLLRFGTEFLRFGPMSGGLTATQWIVGPAAVLLGAALILRERYPQQAVGHGRGPPPCALQRSEYLALFLAAVILAASRWLSPLELVTILGSTLPALAVPLIRRMPQRVAVAPALAIVLFGSPWAQEDTTALRTYLTVGGGAMTGRYEESCGGVHDYQVGGASVAVTRELSDANRITGRAQLFVGTDTEQGGPEQRVSGLGLTGGYDSRYLGVRLGGLGGTLVTDGDTDRLLPAASLRVGRLDRFFVEGSFSDHEPAPVPAPVLKLGMGYGMGDRGSLVRLGVSSSGFFASGRIVLADEFELEPFAAYGDGHHHNLGISVRKQIDISRRPTP